MNGVYEVISSFSNRRIPNTNRLTLGVLDNPRNSAAQYVLNAWLLIPNTFIALAIFLLFRIPEGQLYSSTFGFICSIFELHRVMKSPESLVTKHVLKGVPEVTLI